VIVSGHNKVWKNKKGQLMVIAKFRRKIFSMK
jgi:hypothetical protein